MIMWMLTLDPVLLQLGQLQIRYYGVLMALAFVLGYFTLVKLGKEKKISKEKIEIFFIYLIPLVIICARLFEVFFYEPAYYLANPLEILFLWQGGLASHGGIIGAVLAVWLFCRKYKIKIYEMLDIVSIPFALGAVFIRIGNFLNGELVGRITNIPWAVKFQNYEGFRHPSQLYEAFKNFVLFGILYNMRIIKALKPGVIFWSSIGIFSLFRFFVEFYKDFPLYYGLNIGQIISLPLIILSGVMIYLIQKK